MEKTIINGEKLVAVSDDKIWIKNILEDDVAPFNFSEEEYSELIKKGCSFEKNDCLGNYPNVKGLWISNYKKVDTSGKDEYDEFSNIRMVLEKVDIVKRHFENQNQSSYYEDITEQTEEVETIETDYENAVFACRRTKELQNSPAMWFAPYESIEKNREKLNNTINRFLDNLKKEDIFVQIKYLYKVLDENSIYESVKTKCLSNVVDIVLEEYTVESIDQELEQSVTSVIEKYLSILKRLKLVNDSPARFFAPEGAIDNMQGEYNNALSTLKEGLNLLTVGQLKKLYESFKQSDKYLSQVIQMAIVNKYSAINLKEYKTL